jgi:uncharacterized protein YjfI (DUF2170 family)
LTSLLVTDSLCSRALPVTYSGRYIDQGRQSKAATDTSPEAARRGPRDARGLDSAAARPGPAQGRETAQKTECTPTHPRFERGQRRHVNRQSGTLATSHHYTFSLVEGLEPVIQAVAHDYGDVNVYIAVTGEIAIVQATLFPVARVRDTARLNDRILRTEKLFDLANISIDTHPDGSEFYVIYGALRATSALSDIEFEIDTLARNAVDAAGAYREFVK